ncbi:MAG: nitroreductase family protein [Candidatus Omnitrophica bacterium]|nr:nitroreductase family protein [Candidatus Omnitrophota bacterium]
MELKKVFEQRRSVNFFDTTKKIDLRLFERIYDVAKFCPSSFNLQPWRMIVITVPKNKKKLKEAALNQPKVEEASLMLIVLADTRGFEEMDKIFDDMLEKGYQQEEAREGLKGFARMLYDNPVASRGFALRNASLFAMSFMLAAKNFGVDTHPMDGFEQDRVKKAFNIPDRYEVSMLIAVGFHNKKKVLLERLNRKSFKEVMIKEGFKTGRRE